MESEYASNCVTAGWGEGFHDVWWMTGVVEGVVDDKTGVQYNREANTMKKRKNKEKKELIVHFALVMMKMIDQKELS